MREAHSGLVEHLLGYLVRSERRMRLAEGLRGAEGAGRLTLSFSKAEELSGKRSGNQPQPPSHRAF